MGSVSWRVRVWLQAISALAADACSIALAACVMLILQTRISIFKRLCDRNRWAVELLMFFIDSMRLFHQFKSVVAKDVRVFSWQCFFFKEMSWLDWFRWLVLVIGAQRWEWSREWCIFWNLISSQAVEDWAIRCWKIATIVTIFSVELDWLMGASDRRLPMTPERFWPTMITCPD